MHYTITEMNDLAGSQRLLLNKKGNQYEVGLYNRSTSTYKYRIFDTQEEAEAKFLCLASCIIRGIYNYEDRVKILED